jgi:DNA-directed RNA polymerase subunit M/transcription elongation factor TFIIS
VSHAISANWPSIRKMLSSNTLTSPIDKMENSRMDNPKPVKRMCPECGSDNYAFRGRKKILADEKSNQIEAMETKFRCKACEHEWREKEVAQKR